MIEGLLGKKLGMTQIFDETGRVVPVTVLEVGPCVITQIKSKPTDGYEAVQLGFGHKKRLKSPERGHLRAANAASRHLREFRATNVDEYTVGQVLDCTFFQPGEQVDVTGTSKGKGFQGVMKRHGFHGGPKTHGQSDRSRAPGSIGASATPSRVLKGLRMAGHMGAKQVTVRGLRVMGVNPDRGVLLIRGGVPGPRSGLITIRRSKRRK
jgi:large subunit ribosomal protein L3